MPCPKQVECNRRSATLPTVRNSVGNSVSPNWEELDFAFLKKIIPRFVCNRGVFRKFGIGSPDHPGVYHIF